MLFSSYEFIFIFMPITLFGYWVLSRSTVRRLPLGWLVLCSLVYYAWWNPVYLLLLIPSIGINFLLGRWMLSNTNPRLRRMIAASGIAFNLLILGVFKYANFFVDNINAIAHTDIVLRKIVLPIGISFFSFQQIAYLVDVYRREAGEYHLVDYALFVSFFPQLIAGPIVHHKEIIPQFRSEPRYRMNSRDMAIGMTIFVIGLFKKVVIADNVANYANTVFDQVSSGYGPTFVEAWIGALSYTFQIYFDFSGYSDMAIGVGRMFGIRLPINFDSPYKSRGMIEFWRRWNITLSRFLRDYLYIPLGGNRKGKVRRYINLMITMLLGGLWHGAGWTFMFWGGLHGLYLIVNHLARIVRGVGRHEDLRRRDLRTAVCVVGTFLFVIIAWVFFRVEDFGMALRTVAVMFGADGFGRTNIVSERHALVWIVVLLGFVWFLPSTQEIMGRYSPALNYKERPTTWWQWTPRRRWAVASMVVFIGAVALLSRVGDFIYYQF